MTARAARLGGIAVVFAAGAGVERLWLLRAPPRYAPDLAQPYPIATAWGAYGTCAWAILAATLGAAAILVAFELRAIGTGSGAPAGPRVVVAAAAAALLAAFAWPIGFSSDVYAYAAYGAMLRDGLDPYALLPAGSHGAFYAAARWQWGGAYPVCVYGPLATGLAWLAVVAAGGHGVGAALWTLRATTALAFLASIALLESALAGIAPRLRDTAVCAYGLNPVALWTVAEGHNDAWLLCAAFGAAALARRHHRLGAFAVGLGVLLKAPAAAFALAAACDGRLRGPRGRALRVALAGGALLGLGLWLPLMRPALRTLAVHGRYAPALSLQGLLGPVAALALAAAAAAYGVWALRQSRPDGYAWLGIALCAALPNAYPWYALWLVPFALAAGPGRPATALWAATITAAVRYLPDAAGQLDPVTARLAALVATAPLAYACFDRRSAALRKKVSAVP